MSHRFTYFVYRLVETGCRMLPLGFLWRLGRMLGRIGCLLLPGYKRLVRRNLTIAFGTERTGQEIAWLTRDHFAMLTANLLCSLKMPWMREEDVARHIDVQGQEKIRAALDAGKGVIYALCHMGNWEVLSQTRLFGPGTKSAAMFQALGNPYLNGHVKRQRARRDHRLFDRGDGFNGPAQWLRENGVLGILVDQHAGDGGVWCPFFGRLASTTNLAALLSRRTGAPILPLTVETTAPAFWKITVGDPLPGAGKNLDTDTATAVMNEVLEANIRHSPADWFWMHNRWKTPNPDFLLVHYKRGITLPPGQAVENLQRFEILIRSTNWLGDACMSVPAVRAIRRGRPDARVTVLTPEKLAGFWQQVAEVDEVLSIPKKGGISGAVRAIRQSGRAYDVAVLFPNSLRAGLEAWRAGIPRIVGYKGHSRKWFINQIIPPKKRVGPIEHHVRHYLRIAWRLGADVEDPTLRDPLPGAAGKQSKTLIGSGKEAVVFRWGEDRQEKEVRIGICAGAEYGSAKRWPLDRFAAAIRQIQAAEPDAKIVLFGAPGEKAMGEALSNLLDGQCENLVGRTSLDELMTGLRRCRLLLTNDTGTMHLAALLGTRVAAIFGSTEPDWTGPLGIGHTVIRRHVECSPCFLRECPIDFRCMKEIPPERVSSEVLGMLKI